MIKDLLTNRYYNPSFVTLVSKGDNLFGLMTLASLPRS